MDEILEVEAPDVLTTDELQGPGEVSTQINGIIGAFNEQFDDYVRYSALLTDEFIAAGTFPTRIEVDNRRIREDNGTLTNEVAEPMHRARLMADTSVVNFTAVMDDPAFEEVVGLLNEGVVVGQFYGGYIRILLAEIYCQTPVANGPVQTSDALMQAAGNLLGQAQAGADAVEREDLAMAARVGQARALMWLGEYADAAAIAAEVTEPGFVYEAGYSDNSPEQYNEVFNLTWGRNGSVVRWTVGDGGEDARHNERWPYFDEWVDLGLVTPEANDIADDPFASAVSVTNLQMKYDAASSAIVLASTAEADMILAEVAVRNEQFGTANGIVNGYRAGWGLGPIDFADVAALESGFEVPLPPSADTELKVRLAVIARERARELWITGERQGTLRRFLERDTLDLYPVTGIGTDACYPIPKQETDNNPSL